MSRTFEVELTRERGWWLAMPLDLPNAHVRAKTLPALGPELEAMIRDVTRIPDDEKVFVKFVGGDEPGEFRRLAGL